MNQKISLPNSRLVQSVLLPEVRKLLMEVELSSFFVSPELQRKFISENYRKVVFDLNVWMEKFVDLTNFNYCYPVAGATDGLNQWLFQETRQVYVFDGDYSWIAIQSQKVKVIKSLNEASNGVLYVSNPSAIDGCFRRDWLELGDSGVPIVLDCAYLGTTRQTKLTVPPNVEKVICSFSKSFGLAPLRLGWIWSRKPIDPLEKLVEFGYLAALNLHLTEELTKNFKLDFLFNRLFAEQKRICDRLSLNASDSVLLGYDSSFNNPKFRRGQTDISRIPLYSFYKI